MTKPAMPAARPWLSAWRPSVADTWELEMSSSCTGSAPVLRMFASSCADPIVKPPSICEPLRPSMPSGYCWKSIVGEETSSLSSTIAKCCRPDRPSGWAGCRRSPGRAGRSSFVTRLPRLAALVGEVERDDRRARAARALVEVLLGVLDLLALERDVVLEDVPAVGLRAVLGGFCARRSTVSGWTTMTSAFSRCALGTLASAVGARLLAEPEDLLGLAVDGVVERAVARVVGLDLRGALLGAQQRVVERQAGRRVAGAGAAGDRRRSSDRACRRAR